MPALHFLGRIDDAAFREAIEGAFASVQAEDYEAAIAAFDQAEREFRERDPGRACGQIWFARRNKAEWLAELGKVDEAAALCARSAMEAVEQWGNLDERTMILRNSEIFWLIEAGDYGKAHQQAEALLQDAQMVLPADSELTDAVRNNTGRAATFVGRDERALELYRGLLADYEARGQTEQPPAIMTRSNLANLHEKLGEWREAADLHGKQLRIWRKLGEEGRENALWAKNSYAYCLMLAGETRSAETLWNELTAELQANFGDNHPLLTEIWGVRTLSALDQDQPQVALGYVEKLLEVYRHSGEAKIVVSLIKLANYCHAKLEASST